MVKSFSSETFPFFFHFFFQVKFDHDRGKGEHSFFALEVFFEFFFGHVPRFGVSFSPLIADERVFFLSWFATGTEHCGIIISFLVLPFIKFK